MGFFDKFRGPRPEAEEPKIGYNEAGEKDILDVEPPTGEETKEEMNPEETEE